MAHLFLIDNNKDYLTSIINKSYFVFTDESKQTLTKVFIDYKKKYKSLKRKLYCLVYVSLL